MKSSAYQIVAVTRDRDMVFTREQDKYIKELARANARALEWIKGHRGKV